MTRKRVILCLLAAFSTTLILGSTGFSEAIIENNVMLIVSDTKNALIAIPQDIPADESNGDIISVKRGHKKTKQIEVTNNMDSTINVSMSDYEDDEVIVTCLNSIEIEPGETKKLKVYLKSKHQKKEASGSDENNAGILENAIEIYKPEDESAEKEMERDIPVTFEALWDGGSAEINSSIYLKLLPEDILPGVTKIDSGEIASPNVEVIQEADNGVIDGNNLSADELLYENNE